LVLNPSLSRRHLERQQRHIAGISINRLFVSYLI
jgi:hypothetical protein